MWRCPECKSSRSSSPCPGKTESSLSDVNPQGSIQEELRKIATRLLVLDTLSDDIKLIKSEVQHLKNSLELAHDSIRGFTDKLNELEVKTNKMESLVEELPAIHTELSKLQHDMHQQEQWHRTANIEIKGIPLKQNENLYKIVQDIGEVLDCPIKKTDINFITRVPSRHKESGKPIVVSFMNKYQKEDFMVAVRKRKEITNMT